MYIHLFLILINRAKGFMIREESLHVHKFIIVSYK